ncbi:MAG: ATP-binding protein [Acidaminococcaceae bacterium]
MRELSLHILDLIQNSIEAGARTVVLDINEDDAGYFVFKISDNGRGMSEELLRNIRDPFVTTRTTRKVGMGIPFIDMSTAQSGGKLTITSCLHEGTEIEATFLKDHLDRPPLGDIVATLKVLLVGNPELHFIMHYGVGQSFFELDSVELKKMLGKELDFGFPEVYLWLDEYLRQEIAKVRNEQEARQ